MKSFLAMGNYFAPISEWTILLQLASTHPGVLNRKFMIINIMYQVLY